MPDEADELLACQRYWHSILLLAPATTVHPTMWCFKVTMRINPAATGGGAGGLTYASSVNGVAFHQTTSALQTLVANARM
jgi:hypothetical protein